MPGWRAALPRSSLPISGNPGCSLRSIQPSYRETITNTDALPRFLDWRTINAQALVTGRLAREEEGRYQTEFRLWDVTAGQHLIGHRFSAPAERWRRIGHLISDLVYERLTGEKGYFDKGDD